MERISGTVSRGLRAPIIKTGDDLKSIVVNTVLKAQEAGDIVIRDRDVLAITESIVARSQGNYCSIDDIAEDIRAKFGGEDLGVIFRSHPETGSRSVCAASPEARRRSFCS